jgi:diguanylate cyclase (GGDEF)-like protein
LIDITERKQVEEELRHAKSALEMANLELQRILQHEKLLACTDGLTGLYNRRHFFKLAEREFQAALRYHQPLALMMFDMDDFKWVNDTFGHLAGDNLLVNVAQTTVRHVRSVDVVARYGGDEFIVLLPKASARQAFSIGERIRAAITAIVVESAKELFTVRLSIGIAEVQQEPVDENIEHVIQRADRALYKAKRLGRNRTVIFDEDEPGAV